MLTPVCSGVKHYSKCFFSPTWDHPVVRISTFCVGPIHGKFPAVGRLRLLVFNNSRGIRTATRKGYTKRNS